MSGSDELLRAAEKILRHRTPRLDRRELEAFVESFIERREVFLRAVREFGSPLYVIEEDVLRARAEAFVSAFRRALPDVRVYYAVKSNNCAAVAAALVRAGLGLDVSSGLELELALACGSADVVFSGPGKTDAELALAVRERKRVTVLVDSFGELERLERAAAACGAEVRCGVRLTTDERGLWRKFGIPPCEIGRFIDAAAACEHVRLRGLQFHTSWNLDPANQVRFIERLGATLGGLSAKQRAVIEFLDVGGGYWPPEGEWVHSAATAEGRLREAVAPSARPSMPHCRLPAAGLEKFARSIAEAVQEHVFPHVRCRVCAEPGRWVVNDAMHILLTVVDRKGDDIAITDGGTNAVGWERFESDYFPVINLSRPATEERECYVLGSLCTPHDVWGYWYFGADIRPGDVLVVPTQGAYTYSLRQEFIKPLPRVVVLAGDGGARLWRTGDD